MGSDGVIEQERTDKPPKTAPAPQAEPVLPPAVARRNINEAQWRTLMNSLYPGAKSESVLMVVDYCKARNLDPLKKPCHIVPIDVKVGQTWEKRDVVMPGIYEYRITAHRTELYLGHSKPEYGPAVKFAGVTAPEWCDMTIYRWHRASSKAIEFSVRVLFAEVVATTRDGSANSRWAKAPVQMLTKCTEAAGLREAFPEEFGGEPTEEEIAGQHALDIPPPTVQRISETKQAAQPAERTSPVPPAAAVAEGAPVGQTPLTVGPSAVTAIDQVENKEPDQYIVTLANGQAVIVNETSDAMVIERDIKTHGKQLRGVAVPSADGKTLTLQSFEIA